MNGRVVNGRYRLLSMIGSGGMGNVWLAEDELLGRRVALKELILFPNGEHLSVRRQRVLREARAAARIRHSGIVEVYDMFVEDDLSWIVMAYVRGRSLQDLIEHGPLGERRIAEIGGRVLAALTAAHRADVLHRDVKPANILVGEGGEVFLVDFGIAHIVGESRLTSQNAFAGTLEYMAPERINGLSPGPPADLWSLGATFFHALEGYSPFFRGNVPATMKAITFDDPPRLAREGPLTDAIVRLLRKDPGRRMDARGLEGVLRSIVTDSPPSPRRAAPNLPPRRPLPAAPPHHVRPGPRPHRTHRSHRVRPGPHPHRTTPRHTTRRPCPHRARPRPRPHRARPGSRNARGREPGPPTVHGSEPWISAEWTRPRPPGSSARWRPHPPRDCSTVSPPRPSSGCWSGWSRRPRRRSCWSCPRTGPPRSSTPSRREPPAPC